MVTSFHRYMEELQNELKSSSERLAKKYGSTDATLASYELHPCRWSVSTRGALEIEIRMELLEGRRPGGDV